MTRTQTNPQKQDKAGVMLYLENGNMFQFNIEQNEEMKNIESTLITSFDLIKAAIPDLDYGRKFAFQSAIHASQRQADIVDFISALKDEIDINIDYMQDGRKPLNLNVVSGIAQLQRIIALMAGTCEIPHISNGAEVLFSRKQLLNGITCHLCYQDSASQSYVTWLDNGKEAYWGHYFQSLNAAVNDFNTRCGIPS